jgi:hypothetical protein
VTLKVRKLQKRAAAVEVFRQFAWNLAGSLAKTPKARPPRVAR